MCLPCQGKCGAVHQKRLVQEAAKGTAPAERPASLSAPELQRQGHSVTDRYQANAHPAVFGQALIEGSDGTGTGVVQFWIGRPPRPQRIVDGDQTPRAQQGKRALVVAPVVFLVSVDERE